MDIVVLAGGLSDERDVSLSSGSLIANTLMENGHRVLLVDVYFGIEKVSNFEEAYKLYKQDSFTYKVPETAPDLNEVKRLNNHSEDLVGPNVISVCKTADVAFLALHGSIGENGELQALLNIFNIKYTGSNYDGSLLAMNKTLSKELMSYHNIPTPKWIEYDFEQSVELSFPCVIKPNSNGSSIGVAIVNDEDEFKSAIKELQKFEDTLLIEEKIIGKEFSVGILNGRTLPVIEIVPKSGFYDYKSKYQIGATEEICPALISEDLTGRLQNMALRVHNALRLGYYSRVDFIVDQDEKIYCLEANNLPGMTPTSLLPLEAKAAGISYNELCEMMVEAAVD